jgi:hypothetical protein
MNAHPIRRPNAAIDDGYSHTALKRGSERHVQAKVELTVSTPQRSRDPTAHTAMRADELLDAGDLDGAATWRRVLAAIKELENVEPRGVVH